VRDITKGTHGNGIGIDLANFITKRLHDQIDSHATRVNPLVSAFPVRATVRVVAKHDQEALDLAL
jgi:hypothetical protein